MCNIQGLFNFISVKAFYKLLFSSSKHDSCSFKQGLCEVIKVIKKRTRLQSWSPFQWLKSNWVTPRLSGITAGKTRNFVRSNNKNTLCESPHEKVEKKRCSYQTLAYWRVFRMAVATVLIMSSNGSIITWLHSVVWQKQNHQQLKEAPCSSKLG